MTDTGCHCPGVSFLAGMQSYPDDHWEMWNAGDLPGEPEPIATQEDGLCDHCSGRDQDQSCATRAREIAQFHEIFAEVASDPVGATERLRAIYEGRMTDKP